MTNEFANKLYDLRISQNMTRHDLAEKIGITKAMISYYERGLHLPSFEILSRIADYFNVEPENLVDLDCLSRVDYINSYDVAKRLSNTDIKKDIKEAILSDTQIMDKYNVSMSTVVSYREKFNPDTKPLNHRTHKYTNDIYKRAARLYNDGMKPKQIAYALNIPHRNIPYLIQKLRQRGDIV